ncbi:MAG: sulfatase [Thermoanaerobaculia bacterium]|nr:sulfatase [Thermoanaerobaculia bacterium]
MAHRLSRRLATGLTAMAALIGGCADDPPQAPPARVNVVWITIDALRADHLGSYGYERDTSPYLDELAQRSVRFANAVSQESYTQASVPSYFTSTYPRQHRVLYDEPEIDVLDEDWITVAEVLSEEGYATAAFVFNPHLKRKYGFGQGFDVYDDNRGGWPESGPEHERMETARKMETRVRRYLEDEPRRPVFLYLHYRDVHSPYAPPPPHHATFLPPGVEPEVDILSRRDLGKRRDNDIFVSQYDGEIRYTDDMLRRLVSLLSTWGLSFENTLFVVTADHGEEFFEPHPGDRGGSSHGRTLFREQVHVPLLLTLPGETSGSVVEAHVELTDVVPTILDVVGVDGERFSQFQGRSLIPLIRGEAEPRRVVYAGGNHGRGMVIAGGWKYIRSTKHVRADLGAVGRRPSGDPEHGEELFYLPDDPREQRNLVAERSEVADRMRDLLREREATLRPGSRSAPVELDDETRRRLKALGYLR